VLGLIAATGGTTESIALLDQIAVAPESPPALRMVARLGSAYARYWGRDYAAASAAFEAAAVEDPTGPLADDARYGAAWALYRSGDVEGALAGLRALAGTEEGENDSHVGRALMNLEPRAVFRGSLRRYRAARIGPPHEQLLSLLDLDGVALARAALGRIAGAREEAGPERELTSAMERATPFSSATPESRAAPVATGQHGTSDPASAQGAREASARPAGPQRNRAWLALFAALLVVALVTSVVLRAARRRPRPT